MADQMFHEWAKDLRHGEASEEWAEALAEVVTAVRNTGKPGTLTIVLEVEPGGRTVKITDRVKRKLPEFDREKAIYFADDDGGLHRRDPNQGVLDVDENVTKIDKKTAAAGGRKDSE